MRKPSEYIATALRGIRDNLMSDSACMLTHGYDSATVTRVGSRQLGEDALSVDTPVEAVRVLASAADFQSIVKDSVVLLDDDTRLVTSLRLDPVGVSMTVGLSEALAKFTAHYTGSRRARTISFPLELLAVNNGRATDYTDGYAPVDVLSYTLVIPRESWPESAAPQIGDEARLDSVRLRVSRVTEKDSSYIIAARSR